MRRLLPGMILLALAACRPAAPGGSVVASVIGASSAPLGRIGLVRFDADGRIVPALALRWAILEDGRDYLFRIDDAPGRPSATAVARSLRAAFAGRGVRAAAVPALVAGVQAVTPTVVEVRLVAPQPDLLILLAQPDLAFARAGPGQARADGAILLPPAGAGPAAPVPVRAVPVQAVPVQAVLVRAERVGRAVARFRAGAAQFVTGGTFADLPVAQVAGLDAAALRFDPATGLFGFAAVEGSAFADPALVRALGLALDRERLVAAIDAPGLTTADRIGAAGPEAPLAGRIAEARALLLGRSLPRLRIALPAGSGARLLFALVARDWRRIGLDAVAVAPTAPADLVLVDRVAPPATLPLLACTVSAGCDPRDPRMVAAAPFIAITTPVRWSLVASTLAGYHPNALAAHPLDQLGGPR